MVTCTKPLQWMRIMSVHQSISSAYPKGQLVRAQVPPTPLHAPYSSRAKRCFASHE